ncbi:MAG TPA: VCBS repeat-containing protein [Candidatus Paceibacterota bacterium]|nr:VCBS repeat-containing protein [Verrucomicrobiota bacterium]HRY48010.1 VCBS repeat-containing protein [Candidatus Paceibacterota bacterium]
MAFFGGVWFTGARKLMRILAALFGIGAWGRWIGLAAVIWPWGLVAQSNQTTPGHRVQLLTVATGTQPGFTLISPRESGVWFTNVLPQSRYLTNQILPNGSGVAAGDVDGDGRCDLFLCGLASGGRLYRNAGPWRFEDVTESSGLSLPNFDATGAALVDMDGDGDLDLIVNSIGGGARFFRNNGMGKFEPGMQPLNAGRGGTSIALADADGDGDLDLYLANYRQSTLMDSPGTRFSVKMIDGQPVVAAIDGRPLTDPEWTNRFKFKIELGAGGRGRFGHEELGEADLFCLNDGRGNFQPVSWTEGAFLDEDGQPLQSPPFDWGLTVTFRDFNGDGAPDIYVCNDFNTPDRFWLNDGKGRFRAAPMLALRQTCLACMAIDVADIDRDGDFDFMLVDMLSRDHQRRLTQRNMLRADLTPASRILGRPQYPRNTLFLNRGDGTYAEIGQYAGLEASEWSWAVTFLDVDLDGYEDLLVPNGFERDNMNVDVQNLINQAKASKKVLSREELQLRRHFPRLTTPNAAFRNLGNLRFQEVGREWGFDTPTISQGLCLADFDNDGDLDLAVNNMNSTAGLYRNNASAPRIAVRLKGKAPNTRGIGARITVTGGPVPQSQEMVSGGRYLSCDEALRVFAAGSSSNRLRIEVVWRNGRRSVVEGASPNSLCEIDEAGAMVSSEAHDPNVSAKPVFEDVSRLLAHSHRDEPFDDYARQSLLPRKLSQLGPGVCWWDVDGDDWDDLVIGSGYGGRLALFKNNGQGGFVLVDKAPWNLAVPRDQTAILGWRKGEVLVGGANYEDGLLVGGAVTTYRWDSADTIEAIGLWESSVGPMAMADCNGDGDPDLFVGGRVIPGRYPVAASSRIFRRQNGQWILDEANSARFKDVGIVSGAVWSDLDGDGWSDLILACEWGPVRVWHNSNGILQEVTRELGLSEFTGWWNGVATGDLNSDGRMDIIAANWGQNTKYESHRLKSLRLYHGDLTMDGTVSLLESWYDPGSGRYVPVRMLDAVTKAMPFLAERFSTFEAWSKIGMDDVATDRRERLRALEATTLESMIFLNLGNRFEASRMPMEAQLTPAFAVCVADYDGDGREDVFLSQNCFGVEPDTSRYDAGRGLWLQGDGHGGLRPVPASESGIKVYGEQRGAAVGDFDGDGRVDLVVSQNGEETRLFRNGRAKPGLRVRLQGSEANPRALGAVLRIKSGNRWGAAREIQAGAGYWSQNSAVQILPPPELGAQLWIRWPGGKTHLVDLPDQAREIVVGIDGQARKIH